MPCKMVWMLYTEQGSPGQGFIANLICLQLWNDFLDGSIIRNFPFPWLSPSLILCNDVIHCTSGLFARNECWPWHLQAYRREPKFTKRHLANQGLLSGYQLSVCQRPLSAYTTRECWAVPTPVARYRQFKPWTGSADEQSLPAWSVCSFFSAPFSSLTTSFCSSSVSTGRLAV